MKEMIKRNKRDYTNSVSNNNNSITNTGGDKYSNVSRRRGNIKQSKKSNRNT